MSTRHRRCSLVIPRVMRRHLPLLHALLTYRNCLVVMSPWRCNLSLFSFFYRFYPLQFEDIVVGFFVNKTKRAVDITEKNSDWLTALAPASGDSKAFKLVHTVSRRKGSINTDISELFDQPFSRFITFPIRYVHCEVSFEIKYYKKNIQTFTEADCSCVAFKKHYGTYGCYFFLFM